LYTSLKIQFNIEQKYYSAEFQETYKLRQTPEQLDKFNELAAQNEDVGYDWEDEFIGPPHIHTALYPRIMDIKITSNHDYDDSHPAGTSLNDIFMAQYYSYAQFLGDVDHSDVNVRYIELGYTQKPCNEIDDRELSVIAPWGFALSPMQLPTAWTGKHQIIVTLTDENGKKHWYPAETDFSDKQPQK